MGRRPDGGLEGAGFRALFEGALDAMLIAGDDRRFLDANPAACELFRLPREELLGRRIDDFAGPHAAELASSWGDFLATGSQSGHFILHLDDGSVRHAEYRARASFLPGRHLSVMRDVTVRVAAEQELARSRDALERAVRARDELLAVISHDLRDPVGVVSLSAAMLRRRLVDHEAPGASIPFVERIERAVARMNVIISDLLDLARLDEGKLPLEPSPQPLAPIVEEAIGHIKALAAEKKLRLDCIHRLTRRVVCDRGRVLQVLSNLLGNAVKFTPPGGTVEVEAEERDSEAQVVVRDTGPGVAEAEQPRIFDRYYTRRPGGAGLGLAIVKGVVEAHGGRVWVESRRGEGSRFGFTLPLER